MPTLSILIPSLVTRRPLRERLMQQLHAQAHPDVEVLIDEDDGEATIGDKRNRLIARATGQWVCFVDDDDGVADDFVSSILTALELSPDCVGFYVRRFIDGHYRGELAKHSLEYDKYATITGRIRYERTPNHLNPVRRSIAAQVPFLPLNRGEDTDYAVRLRPLLKSEVFVAKPLYDYLYRTRRPGEVTNAKRQ